MSDSRRDPHTAFSDQEMQEKSLFFPLKTDNFKLLLLYKMTHAFILHKHVGNCWNQTQQENDIIFNTFDQKKV